MTFAHDVGTVLRGFPEEISMNCSDKTACGKAAILKAPAGSYSPDRKHLCGPSAPDRPTPTLLITVTYVCC